MFDFHMHTIVSFDGKATPQQMVKAAESMGLKEICFTDHIDYDPLAKEQIMRFDTRVYNEAYDALTSASVKIRRGMEFGMVSDYPENLKQELQRRPFDFVIGSVHYVENYDIYYPPYWEGKTMDQAEQRYLEEVLACVKNHDDFDVLGHLTYISKAWNNPTNRPVCYESYRDLVDEIFRVLIAKGKGIEVNTSGIKSCGVYLPGEEYVRRFKELGGQIVTVGSDAHTSDRVGEHCFAVCDMLKDIFGYVCTFEERKPIFHKL